MTVLAVAYNKQMDIVCSEISELDFPTIVGRFITNPAYTKEKGRFAYVIPFYFRDRSAAEAARPEILARKMQPPKTASAVIPDVDELEAGEPILQRYEAYEN